MRKHSTPLLAAASAVIATGAAVILGLTAASAAPARPAAAPARPAAVSPRPAAGPSVSGTEHFRFMTTNGDSNTESVIALGVFIEGGIDHPGRADKVIFADGTFRIRNSAGHGRTTFNHRTCLGIDNLRGTYKIYGGTGKYAGISGHGKYLSRARLVTKRNSAGRCDGSALAASQQVIWEHGPVKLHRM